MTIVAGNYEVSEALTAEQLLERLQDILRSPSSGTVTLQQADGTSIGSLQFNLGRLLWATGGQHRWRRWQRLTQQHCPGIKDYPIEGSTSSDDWEYQTLIRLVRQKKVERASALAVLQKSIIETLFDIFQASQNGCKFSSSILTDSEASQLSVGNDAGLLAQANQEWLAWKAAGLSACSPDVAPVVRNAAALQQRTSPQAYQTLTQLLNGQATLRELAVTMRQNLPTLAKTLLAYVQSDLIGLDNIADIASPGHSGVSNISTNNPSPSVSGDAPLIMCIDDNPKVCEMLGKILTTAGYQFVSVQDSLQALPVLLERKPDLVFLDLVMPVASGYEVCAQIRRISMFQDLPIVILTGNDGIIDRIRSKTSGATDFISKPLDVSKVLGAVKHYLPDRVPSPA